MAFWDTSALLKLYVRERDSDRFHHLIQTLPEKTAISQFTLAEMHRALWAKVFARAVPANFAQKAYREFRADGWIVEEGQPGGSEERKPAVFIGRLRRDVLTVTVRYGSEPKELGPFELRKGGVVAAKVAPTTSRLSSGQPCHPVPRP